MPAQPNSASSEMLPEHRSRQLHTLAATHTRASSKYSSSALCVDALLTLCRFCFAPDGSEVEIVLDEEEESSATTAQDHSHGASTATGASSSPSVAASSGSGRNYHFRASVEYAVLFAVAFGMLT
jgi:hypothetical protein